VRRIEHLGSDRLLYGSLKGKDETNIIAKLPFTVSVRVCEEKDYEFAVRTGDLKFFDRESGLRTEARF